MPPARLRLGVWMVYEQSGHRGTVLPFEGIGVLTCNLLRSIVKRTDEVEAVVLCLPEGRAKLEETLGVHSNLSYVFPVIPGAAPPPPPPPPAPVPAPVVAISPPAEPPPPPRPGLLKRAVRRVKRFARSGLGKGRTAYNRYAEARDPDRVFARLRETVGPTAAKILLAVTSPLWVLGYAVETYAMATARLVVRVGKHARRMLAWRPPPPPPPPAAPSGEAAFQAIVAGEPVAPPPPVAAPDMAELLAEAARGAKCDVWWTTTLYSECPADLPAVLFLFDLVTAHYPEAFNRYEVIRSFRRAVGNGRRAALVGCFAEVIRDTDLLAQCGLAAEKVRVVPTALSDDVADETDNPSPAVKEAAERPFLFYPTVFRNHKNLPRLLVAFSLLRRSPEWRDVTLVLTNPRIPEIEARYRSFIDMLDLTPHVRVLGDVARGEVAWLYRRAAATVISSLYEGIGLQLFEALEAGSPVACSRLPVFEEHCRGYGESVPMFDPLDPADMAAVIARLLRDRDGYRERQQELYRARARRTWDVAAPEWLDVFREGAAVGPGGPPARRPRDRRVCLILPNRVFGGLLEATKDLIRTLAEVAAARGGLALTLLVPPGQLAVDDFRRSMAVEELILDPLAPHEFCHVALHPRDVTLFGCSPYSVVSNLSALAADAWMFLNDRVFCPLVAERPYGVMVYDMIQVRAPETFPEDFHHLYRHGIRPTVLNADLVVSTSPVTRDDVVQHIAPVKGNVRLLPVSCEPHLRFVGMEPEAVPLPPGEFILNVNNGAPHKGIVRMLTGYAALRRRLGDAAPALVVCGINTDKFDPAYRGTEDYPPWVAARKLVGDLGLRVGQDVVFLGMVSDPVMYFLFRECRVVVNSAIHDNGSFNLIEGRYYGKPAVCTHYPAAEWLYRRFRVPVHYFVPEDAEDMATAIEKALATPPLSADELATARRGLADPELGLRVYAERMYDMLGELARTGEELADEEPADPLPVTLPFRQRAG